MEKSQKFKGGNSEAAHVFKHAFRVWARSEQDRFTETDVASVVQHNANGSVKVESQKVILSALSMMEGPAAEWAQTYLETTNDLDLAKHPFSNFSGAEFWKAFEAKWKPVMAVMDAKIKLDKVTQGKDKSFASYLNRFKRQLAQISYSEVNLIDKLVKGLDSDYQMRLSYFQPLPTTMAQYETYGLQIDTTINNLCLQQKKAPLSSSHNVSLSKTRSAFHDSNAIDIDASRFDD